MNAEKPPMQAADDAWKNPPRRRLQSYTLQDMEVLPKREYLIKGMIDRGGMTVLYGDSNSGKTFTAINISFHVSLGWSWCCRRVRKGRVLYIAAEGGLGIRERIRAFQLKHEISENMPFFIIPAAVNLCNFTEDTMEIIEEATRLGSIDLIVIDTFARAMGDGDENGSGDMGKFIKNCDSIRQKTGAHVILVHHTGKDAAKGARGHSSLRAAVDTEISVSKDGEGIISVEIKKQRDGRTGDVFHFMLETVMLEKDEDGEPVTSCVLLPSDALPQKKQKLSPQHQRAFSVLADLMVERGERGIPKTGMQTTPFVRTEHFRAALLSANISAGTEPDNVRRQVQRIIEALNNKGVTATWEDKTWIIGQAGQNWTDKK